MTAKEQGYDIVGTGWYGMWAPAGMGKTEQMKLNAIVINALKEPETQERFKKLGLIVNTSTPEALNALQLADLKQWAPIIDASGFKPND
jgi:tripartite-type tricarboxylate transporter receptor subunit TctC